MPRPGLSIRRFDVSTEYDRLDQLREGMQADDPRGDGFWLAKVFALRRFGKEEVQEKEYPPS